MMAPTRHSLLKLFGIEIRFHVSWLIILFLIALSLSSYFRSANPEWTLAMVWGIALLTTVLFFVSVILHELAHSLTARRFGLPVHAITLFVFGGVSELPREPEQASAEFWIAIAGPATSVVLGALFLGLAQLGDRHSPLIALSWWLGSINLMLAIFNLLPGFPLDGGRILRAVLWLAKRDFMKATRWATRVGKVVALLLIAGGVFEFFLGRGLGGLWLAFIGWFLLSAAEQSWRQTEIRDALANYTVRDLATPFFSRVSPGLTLEDYFDHVVEGASYRSSLVMNEEDELLGVIGPSELRAIPRSRWTETRVEQAMIPRERLRTVDPSEALTGVLEQMAQENLHQIPVIAGSRVEGVIQRDRILHLLQSQLSTRPQA